MFLHGGFQNLWGQIQKFLINLTHQNNGPFHESCHLSQQAGVFHHALAQRKSLGLGFLPNRSLPLIGPQDHFGALQLGFVILKTTHRKGIWRHETVTAGLVASFNAVHVERDNRDFGLIGQDTKDRLQRPHPAQTPRPPAHRFWPREIANSRF